MSGAIRPTEQCVNVHDPARAYKGYTLFAPHYGKSVWLIDMDGRVVNRWALKHLPGGDGRLLPNGNLLRLNKTMNEPLLFFGSVASELVELDWDGNLVWRHEDPYLHHDFYPMSNGNIMLNRHVAVPPEIAAKVKGGLPGTELKDGMWTNGFQEITRDGKVVWEWRAYEHLDFDIDVICPLCPRTMWGYDNAVCVLPNGDLLTSLRDLNTIAIIDRGTGAIKWRWGRTNGLGHQHNPTMLENGHILVFDNGYHRVTDHEASDDIHSRILEIDPQKGKVEWSYEDENLNRFFSGICSGAQRLPNGNTLICESLKGRLFEVTSSKEIVWEFVNPLAYFWPGKGKSNLVFKAHRYGPDYPGLVGKALDPGRFEWVLKERGKDAVEDVQDDRAEKIARRLKHLGY